MKHRVYPLLATLLLCVGLAGCGGVALGHAFNDYSATYAEVKNKQLLLNLARMSLSHPPHFLQLGLINTTFQFGANAGATAGGIRTSGRPGSTTPMALLSRVTQWGATAGAVVNEQPTFAFTPLAGPQFAQGFLAAVPPSVFFALLEQGEPIDQLMRVLVQAVEFTDPTTGNTVTLLNDPNVADPKSYIDFLRVAGLAVELQQRQALSVLTTSVVTAAPAPVFTSPTLDDTLKLAEKGFILKETAPGSGKFTIATTVTSTKLQLGTGAEKLLAELGKQPYYSVDVRGFMSLKLRSFFSIMSWVSLEQEVFDQLAAKPGFLEGLPPSQRQPVIKITWDKSRADLQPPLVALDYGGQVYAITDVPGTTWNRDIFTLLSYIESVVALDPKSLPVQQLIQVK